MNQPHAIATSLVTLLLAGAATAVPPTTLPAGPDKMPARMAPPLDPATPPMVFGARLAVRAVQKTPGGPDIGPAEVQVQLVHRGMVIDTIDTQLDEHGVVVLDDLKLELPVQPVVVVKHAGVTYQRTGDVLDAAHAEQMVEVPCYELTEEVPDWKVLMRHVMIAPAAEGLRVNEMLVIENPADHTWLGREGTNGKRITTTFTLPEHAGGLELGRGFHDWCCSTFDEDRLVNHLPLMPGTTEMSFSYHVHAHDESATVEVTAPAPIDQMMVITPEQMTVAAAEGVEAGGTQEFRGQRVRIYLAGNLATGQVASLVFTGLGAAELTAAATRASSAPAGSFGSTKVVAAIGGGLLLLVAAFMIVARSPKTAPAR